MGIAVTVSHLEMLSPDELRAKVAPAGDVRLVRWPTPLPELNRFFYTTIGGDWFWWERLPWTYTDWMNYLTRPEVSTWLITRDGLPVGYCELEQQPDDNVEIVYFGMLAINTGQGLGGWALSEVVRQAWGLGAKRVWVHTCDLDHPAALANYQARGFRLFKTVTAMEDIAPQPPGPWPGAQKEAWRC